MRTLGRMRGQILDWVCCMRRDFAAPAASFFPSDGKETKGSPGTAPDEHFVLIVAFPRTPLRGTRTCWILQNFRRAKSGWRSAIPTAPQGAGCSKIAVGAVYRLRLALPSHRSWCEFGREAQGPPLPRLRIVFGNPQGRGLPLPPIPTAQLGPRHNKDAVKEGSARLPINRWVSGSERRGEVGQLSYPRLCVDRQLLRIGGPRKTGSRGREYGHAVPI